MKMKWMFCKSKEVLKLSDTQLDKVVKIKGTQYDRKRKLTDRQVSRMKKLYNEGVSIASIADTYSVSQNCVKEHVNPEFYEKSLASKRKWRTENSFKLPKPTVEEAQEIVSERASYKRNLVGTNKIVIK